MVEMEEETNADETTPLLSGPDGPARARARSVRTKVPEVEVHLYRKGNGPIDVFKCRLAGWDQNQLEVREILDKYRFKSIYAFSTDSGRGVPIRFNPRNGRSIRTYNDGSVIHVDGEPKDSSMKPITKISIGVAAITILIAFLVMKETPEWAKKLKGVRIPPWILVSLIIAFTRMRKELGILWRFVVDGS